MQARSMGMGGMSLLPARGKALLFSSLFRDALLPLIVLSLIALLPQPFSTAAMIIGGQAHFAMAYLYQYRAGKMTIRYYAIAVLLALLALAYFYFSGAFWPLYLAASLVFGVHFATDEVALHGEKWSVPNSLAVVVFVALFSSIVLPVMYPTLDMLPLWVAGCALLYGAWRVITSFRTITKTERYLWYVGAALFAFSLLVPPILLAGVTLFVIWIHYLNWMLAYGVKVEGSPRASRYWRDTLWTSGASLVLGVAHIGLSVPLLGILYSHSAFHAWAIAHIVLSSPLVVGAHKGYG